MNHPFLSRDLFAALTGREPWREQAACADHDGDMWFPGVGEKAMEARTICRSCPVRAECLDYALEHRIQHGVWGGLPEKPRADIVARHRRAS